MNEYFVVANTYAAPFFSDTNYHFINADTPEDALKIFLAGHEKSTYSAGVYVSANEYHKNQKPICKYLSKKALVKE